MGVLKSQCTIVKVDSDTAGGPTYFVKLPYKREEEAICFRRKSTKKGDTGQRCTNRAGYGTWHLGEGACKLHGGCAGRPPLTAKNAVQAKRRLQSKVDEYLNKDRSELLDLTSELAFTRAMFDEFTENFPDPTDDNYGIAFHRFSVIVGTLGSLVEKMSKIDSRNTLTTAQVLYLRATIADIFLKYLPDPMTRERAVRELANRLGGDVSLEMRPSEFVANNRMLEA